MVVWVRNAPISSGTWTFGHQPVVLFGKAMDALWDAALLQEIQHLGGLWGFKPSGSFSVSCLWVKMWSLTYYAWFHASPITDNPSGANKLFLPWESLGMGPDHTSITGHLKEFRNKHTEKCVWKRQNLNSRSKELPASQYNWHCPGHSETRA